MQNLSIEEIVANIKQGVCFEATHKGDFYLKIHEYVPFVCAAIHDGHRFRASLEELCLLDESERYFEEDPFTGEFIQSLPITLIGGDSRYEYDLNRDESKCIYDIAWGEKVWENELPKNEIAISLQKHRNFYRVVHALIEKLESDFGASVIYDMHSYNHQRHDTTYLFNIGIENIDIKRYNSEISHWKRELLKIKVKRVKTEVSVNHIFYGRGYLLKYVKDNFNNSLVLATEVKKVYMDEATGTAYPQIIQALSKSFKNIIINNSQHYINRLANFNVKKKSSLLHGGLQPELIKFDKALYRLVKNFELLNYVNPVNLETEKSKFFKAKGNYNPEYRYKPLTIDPHIFKAKMYRLDVDSLEDAHMRQIYIDIINAYADKVDMLSALGSEKFLYNSLRYFGEPTQQDISNANFLMYCNELPQFEEEVILSSDKVKKIFKAEGARYGFDFKVEESKTIPSDALVINSKQTVYLKKGAFFTQSRITALLNHEIGVHMVTTKNAQLQPLRFLSMGLPKNTHTQEGLAIMSELKSGCLTITRLKELAMRVLAVDMMTKGFDFKSTYHQLKASNTLTDDKLYYLLARVYRGGGFTKDYLYLNGFRSVLRLEGSEVSIDNLFLGKTSHAYLSLLNEFVDRGILEKPRYFCNSFSDPKPYGSILKYLTGNMK
jgi:uncharacterized protein (TIGR02421 family)